MRARSGGGRCPKKGMKKAPEERREMPGASSFAKYIFEEVLKTDFIVSAAASE